MKFSLKNSIKWSIFISAITFLLACIFSVASTFMLQGEGWGIGMLVVFALILVGVLFDILGLSAAAARETPFHGMAAERVKGAKQAIQIIRNADRFSNFCNDVIGDITGIISGTASALVVISLLTSMESGSAAVHLTVSVVFSGFVAALTVGGKAIGKSIAIHFATPIMLSAGKFFYFLENRCGIKVFKAKKSNSNGKRGNNRASGTNS